MQALWPCSWLFPIWRTSVVFGNSEYEMYLFMFRHRHSWACRHPDLLWRTCSLQWRHNECNGISNHQHLNGLLNCLIRRRSKNTSKLHVTGLCEGNSPVTSECPLQRASSMENVSISWCHHHYPFLQEKTSHYEPCHLNCQTAWHSEPINGT